MALALKSSVVARPQAAKVSARKAVVVRAQKPAVDMSKQVQQSVKEAEEACAKGTAQDCAVAWDVVEEVSAAAAHNKEANKAPEISDPLEAFCQDDPSADECRVYSD